MQLDEKIRREYERMKKRPDYDGLQNILTLKQKQQHAEKIITLHVAGSFSIGFIPIPFSDAPILIANQAGMLARVLNAYDMDDIADIVLKLIGQIGIGKLLSDCAARGAGYLTSQLLKFIPGFGTIAGGLINGTMAASITYAFGIAVSRYCYYRCKNDNSSSLTKKDFEVFTQAFGQAIKNHSRHDKQIKF